VFNALHLFDLVMIGLVLRLPKFMVYYGFSPGFIFSYLSTGQEIGWKERLRYDLCCVEWDVKPQLSRVLLFHPHLSGFCADCRRPNVVATRVCSTHCTESQLRKAC